MKVRMIIAEYHKDVNMVSEHRAGTSAILKLAELWLHLINKPAMIYIDGSQETDYPQYSANDLYHKEYAKIKENTPRIIQFMNLNEIKKKNIKED